MRNSRKRGTLLRAESQKRLNLFKLFRDGPNLSRFDACGALTRCLGKDGPIMATHSSKDFEQIAAAIYIELTHVCRHAKQFEAAAMWYRLGRNGISRDLRPIRSHMPAIQ